VKLVFYRTRYAKMIDGVRRGFPDVDVVLAQSLSELESAIPGAEIFVTTNNAYAPDVAGVVRGKGADLRWLHFTNSGIDYALENGVPAGVAITNSSSARSRSVASHAFALLLALARRLPESAQSRARRDWPRIEMNNAVVQLDKKTMTLIGLGAIGQDIARKAKAFDMRVIAISRGGSAPHVDEVRPRAELLRSLAEADVVMIATAYDSETHHMIDAAAIAAMRPGAMLINIARGAIVDEPALVKALQDGRLSAGLDVTEPEPPAPDSPLWELPNVVLTPHSAAGGGDEDMLLDILAEHLRLFRSGKPFARVVCGPNGGG
jgi:phosphoglycerate dehydrogenase-like enzyme